MHTAQHELYGTLACFSLLLNNYAQQVICNNYGTSIMRWERLVVKIMLNNQITVFIYLPWEKKQHFVKSLFL